MISDLPLVVQVLVRAHDYVFSTAWGKPIHPDTVSSLMTTLTNTRNASRASRYLTPGGVI